MAGMDGMHLLFLWVRSAQLNNDVDVSPSNQVIREQLRFNEAEADRRPRAAASGPPTPHRASKAGQAQAQWTNHAHDIPPSRRQHHKQIIGLGLGGTPAERTE